MRPCVVDPQRELVRGEPAEDDRVDRAQPRAREHRHHGLGDHRHVDDDAVAVVHAEIAQRAGEPRDLLAQLGVREDGDRLGHRAVMDQRGLVRAPSVGVAVERVVARVQLTAGEPAVERRGVRVEHACGRGEPFDRGGGLTPEAVGILEAAAMCFGVARHPPIFPRAQRFGVVRPRRLAVQVR